MAVSNCVSVLAQDLLVLPDSISETGGNLPTEIINLYPSRSDRSRFRSEKHEDSSGESRRPLQRVHKTQKLGPDHRVQSLPTHKVDLIDVEIVDAVNVVDGGGELVGVDAPGGGDVDGDGPGEVTDHGAVDADEAAEELQREVKGWGKTAGNAGVVEEFDEERLGEESPEEVSRGDVVRSEIVFFCEFAR